MYGVQQAFQQSKRRALRGHGPASPEGRIRMPTSRSPDEDRAGAGVARRLFSRRVIVRDESMRPALEPGDRLLVDTRVLRARLPRIGEIVVLRDPIAPTRWLIKRVGAVDAARATVEVRGDAADRARDSRQFGPVPFAAIVGVAYRRYAPSTRRAEL
jgi:nickel-type superoxide dismutase maturation protease